MTVSSSDTSTISAVTDAASAALAGGIAGVGVAVGAALAHNAIGNGTTGETAPGQVQAYIKNTSINSTGALSVTTTTHETITAEVGSVSAAVGVGFVGVSVAAAGTVARNDIGLNIDAYISGNQASGGSQTGVVAGSVALSGTDTSLIDATVDSAALSASFGAVGVAAAVGVSQATNEITNNMEVDIANATVTANTGSVTVSANEGATISAYAASAAVAISGGAVGVSVSGGGAEATNVILDDTNAYLSGSVISAHNNVSTSAIAAATITADILAASASAAFGAGAAAASIGVGIAENYIGYSYNGVTATYDPDQVEAYSTGTSVNAGGAFNQTATDTSTINANVAALSAALVGALVGDTLSGAGATALNQIAVNTETTLSGSGSAGIHVGSLDFGATDNTTINANVAAVSLAIAVSLGNSLSMSESLAQNSIDNQVQSSITSATVVASGPVTVDATENANISAISAAASVAASIGFSGSAGAAVALNTINTNTSAYVESSSLTVTGGGGDHDRWAGCVVGQRLDRFRVGRGGNNFDRRRRLGCNRQCH